MTVAALRPTDLNITWEMAESKFPECSAAWDRDGGPAWLEKYGTKGLAIVHAPWDNHLSIATREESPFQWAFWDRNHKKWTFPFND